jgi:hypothetical protein
MSSDYVEGFLEGHEGPGVKLLYRLFMFSYVVLSLFAGVCNIGAMTHEGAEFNNVLNSVVILGLLAMSLVHVAWYRRDNLDPKHRKSSFLLIVLVLILDTAACIAFHRTLTYTAPVAAPVATMEPSTFPPNTYQPANSTLAPTSVPPPGKMRIN